jgi:type IV secretory pathway VirB10-like protein
MKRAKLWLAVALAAAALLLGSCDYESIKPKEEPKPAVQPAKPAEPVAPAQPATPVQPIETKPYVPPVVPASEVEDDEPEETEEESYMEPKEKKGFWGWVKKITEGFEAPGDEEI